MQGHSPVVMSHVEEREPWGSHWQAVREGKEGGEGGEGREGRGGREEGERGKINQNPPINHANYLRRQDPFPASKNPRAHLSHGRNEIGRVRSNPFSQTSHRSPPVLAEQLEHTPLTGSHD